MNDDWSVAPSVSTAVAYAVLSEDRIANGYALADLEPPFGPYTTVATATRRGESEPSAACQVLRDPSFSAMVTHGDADGIAAIFDAIDLPPTTHAALREDHVAPAERWYSLDHRSERMRMAVTAGTFRRPADAAVAVVRLDERDAAELLRLYADYDESFFMPAQLRGGVFCGVREDGRLVAAAGTHVVAHEASVAAVGNIFVQPGSRGRGHGAAVAAAVTAELLAMSIRDVILNVAVGNAPAIAIYRRLGYRTHNHYWEAQATLRAAVGSGQ